MARIYLAATFSRAEEMKSHIEELAGLGHKVCARWIDSHEVVMGPAEIMKSEEQLEKARKSAVGDIADIIISDAVILFTDMPSSTGGRHTELGLAIAFGKSIAIVGPRENVFQAYTGIAQFNTWEDFVIEVRRSRAASKTRSTETPHS